MVEMNELKRVKNLEEENRKLKQMYADLALDNKMLKCKLPIFRAAEIRQILLVIMVNFGCGLKKLFLVNKKK